MYEWKDDSMDKRSRRSLSKNERMPRIVTNDGHTNKGRNSNNVPRNRRRNLKRSTNGRKGKEINPRILLLSDKPIKQILAKPEKSSRIAKWAIEMGEHEIEFKGRNSTKGQILADFLAETPPSENREANNEEVKRKEPEPKNAWKLFTDGASSSDSSRAGLMVVSPERKEYTYALRFEFKTTNNEAEYEALLTGLRIAKEMEIRELIIFVDSQLVANQDKGLFEARQPTIKQRPQQTSINDLFQTHERSSSRSHTKQVHRGKGSGGHSPRRKRQLDDTYPIIFEIRNPTCDLQKARKLRIKALLYKMMEEKLYRRSYLSPWLRCVGPMQANNIIKEVHEGLCGMHSGPRLVVSKITILGYYWPSMHKDAKELIQKCETCQIYSSVPRKPKQEMTSIMSAWPFSQWGIDIVGPLPTAPRGARFLVLAIDHFTKWVEAKPLISTTRRHMEKFIWEHIVCWFARPLIIISDNGKQFIEGTFLIFYKKLGMLQASISVYHPQTNGQVEVTNKEIIKGMERRLGKAHQAWIDELPQVLWAHRTTPKSSNGKTPFSLVYSLEAVIPIEISVETKRVASKAKYQGKMGPTWEGPYVIRKAYGDRANKLETLSGEAVDRTWNGTNLRKLYV
ncbi:reverse transcriptase domain-containing protein [Tanacetum coccineum]